MPPHRCSKSTQAGTTRRKAGSAGKFSNRVKCTICDTEVSRKADMPRHMKLHNSDPTIKLQCPWEGCAHSTLQKSNLETHYRRHTNDKKFICHGKDDTTETGNCKFQTCDPAALNRHRRSHDTREAREAEQAGQAGPSNSFEIGNPIPRAFPSGESETIFSSPSETLQVFGCTDSSPHCQGLPFPNCPQPVTAAFDYIWENNVFLLCEVGFLNLSAADPVLWNMPHNCQWPGCTSDCTQAGNVASYYY